MKPPSIKKILREDVKDAPSWVNAIIDPLNNFMESVYQALNKNITFGENVACFIKEITYKTPATYPVMDDVQFLTTLKTKAVGVFLLQAIDKATYTPAVGPVYVPWYENNGNIVIRPITGLEADKTYIIRLLVTWINTLKRGYQYRLL